MLVTLNEIKVFLGISLSDTSQDALLTIFQESVEQSVINYTETDFASHSADEVLDGIRSDVVVPRNFPILDVTQFYIGVAADGSGGTLLEKNIQYTFTESAITLRNIHTPFSRSIVRVVYDYGYSSVPGDVKHVIYQAVKAEFQRYKRNSEDVSSRSKGDESESYGGAWDGLSGLPKQLVSKLQPYRVMQFANIPMAQRNS